ncbi:hypothetical protein [Actinomadura geliboluensis]|uniref:TolB-like translocation protein n=1 Tax=Actinomadura geliboluensis TaxID=882440 RepID=A0A5S4G936_9ACTN|nr:hypothetical protein [Actinomadura geliboluensis]TMR29527.1 hypothetical protein ETD96_35445 [Actinomadura geliboluensis]
MTMKPQTRRRRTMSAVTGTVLLAVVAGLSVNAARDRASEGTGGIGPVSLAPGTGLIARSTADRSRGRLIARSGDRRTASRLKCERLYAAAGTGICLRLDGDLTTYQLALLDRDLRVRREIPLVGVPNRARVSPSGRLVSWTVFVAGDSYNGGRFSTRVGILDTSTQHLTTTLEDWKVTVAGKPYRARDLNFWGVTFSSDDRHFYATMSTRGHRFLVHGDLATRHLRTVVDKVECPSLSPDETRIAFKSARGGDPDRGWRLSVLELATGKVTQLAETRSVDDQAAWLDAKTIAYAVPRHRTHSDIWAVPADGTGSPHIIVPDAESPAPLTSGAQAQ